MSQQQIHPLFKRLYHAIESEDDRAPLFHIINRLKRLQSDMDHETFCLETKKLYLILKESSNLDCQKGATSIENDKHLSVMLLDRDPNDVAKKFYDQIMDMLNTEYTFTPYLTLRETEISGRPLWTEDTFLSWRTQEDIKKKIKKFILFCKRYDIDCKPNNIHGFDDIDLLERRVHNIICRISYSNVPMHQSPIQQMLTQPQTQSQVSSPEGAVGTSSKTKFSTSKHKGYKSMQMG